MDGKTKCRFLKEMRKQIADENNIPFEISDCDYEGDCRGTCQKCDEELQYLTKLLKEKESQGEHVTIPKRSIEKSNTTVSDHQERIDKYKLAGAIDYIDDGHNDEWEFDIRKFIK